MIRQTGSINLHGSLSPENKRAIDWGPHNTIAFGAHDLIIIADAATAKVIQTLSGHHVSVTCVRWCAQNFYQDPTQPSLLPLASCDANGWIICWNVANGSERQKFRESHSLITDMMWLSQFQDISRDLLLVLHSPSTFVLWNTSTGAKLWRFVFSETLVSFALDPFDRNHFAALTSDSVLCFVDDLSITSRSPSLQAVRRFGVLPSTPPAPKVHQPVSHKKSDSPISLTQRVTRILQGEGSPSTERANQSSSNNRAHGFFYIAYNDALKNHMLLVAAHEVLMIDLEFGHLVATFNTGAGSDWVITNSLFLHAFTYESTGDLVCLHENGVITVRRPHFDEKNGLVYELIAHSNSMRITKSTRPMSFAVCPTTGASFSILLSDGRVFVWRMCEFDFGSAIPQKVAERVTPKLGLCAIIGGSTAQPTVVQMCPALTLRNQNEYKALFALGANNGTVQIVEAHTSCVLREFSLTNAPIRDIVWASMKTLLVLAGSSSVHSPAGGSGGFLTPTLARNEVYYLDLSTGESRLFREKRDFEPAIETMKISPKRWFVAFVFLHKPTEIWDMRTESLIRELPRGLQVVALEWNPNITIRQTTKKLEEETHADLKADMPPLGTTDRVAVEHWVNRLPFREHLMCLAPSGQIVFFSLLNDSLVQCATLSSEEYLRNVTAIAWKGDNLCRGDADGMMNVWDLKKQSNFTFQPEFKGRIKKICYAPGRRNDRVAVLHTDHITVYEPAETDSSARSLRLGVELCARPTDFTWLDSLHLCILLENGALIMRNCDALHDPLPVSGVNEEKNIFASRVLKPQLTPKSSQIAFRSHLQRTPHAEPFLLGKGGDEVDTKEKGEGGKVVDQLTRVVSWNLTQLLQRFEAMYPHIARFFRSDKSTFAERALILSRLFGDAYSTKFWQIANFYLTRKSSPGSGALDVSLPPLDRSFGLLADCDSFHSRLLHRLHVEESRKELSRDNIQSLIHWLILLGEHDRAVQMLLDEDLSGGEKEGYVDSLRACLVASVKTGGGEGQSTMKLVATSLITGGRLNEGIELLCMMHKHSDACRYLQTYDEWNKSAVLSKCMLETDERATALKRYAVRLRSPAVDDKVLALLLLLSISDFDATTEALFAARQYDLVANFVEAREELIGPRPVADQDASSDTYGPLLDAAWCQHARTLNSAGLKRAARHYCVRAGAIGDQIWSEITSQTLVASSGVE